MTLPPRVIVITDLDGTLLDHSTYRFDAAIPALEFLKNNHIPLILSSSKTAVEMKALRQKLDNHDPFVAENGAGIYLPTNNAYKKISFGLNRDAILAVLEQMREQEQWQFVGFNDMSVDEVMEKTGLRREQAEMAKQRDFTEPLQWQGNKDQLQEFRDKLAAQGLTAVQGGRFISISGKVDKGQALSWLREYYRQQFSAHPVIVALGDSENDRPMLENADYAILIRSPAHDFPDIKASNLIKTDAVGPLGWNNSLLALLQELTEQR